MNQNYPLVSVIIIAKNGERFIREALQSVFNQNYRPLEVIVVDGNSKDNTVKIVQEFDVQDVIIQKKSGIADAYNTGIKRSTAEFVSFLSSDDLWLHNKLITQMNYLLTHSDVEIINSHIEYFLEEGMDIPLGFKKDLLKGSHPARIMENLVARKRVFDKVGYFNTALSTAEDVDWYSRAQDMQISSHILKNVLLKKRIHDNNSSLNAGINNQNLMMVLRKALDRKKHSKGSNLN